MVLFRDEHYQRNVFLGKRTIKQGECCIRWNLLGQPKVIIGPKRQWFYRSTIQFMTRYVAGNGQYLEVIGRDGKKHHARGPYTMFADPVEHKKVTVKNAIRVLKHQAIVIFSEDEKHDVSRRVVMGPTVFFPEPNEWLGEFQWHAPKDDESGRYVPNKRIFSTLSLLPESLYYSISEVRTSDDAKLTVNLTIRLQLSDIEKMLKETQDPIGGILNSACADIITFAASKTLEMFVSSSSQLNTLEVYPMLTKRAEKIGYDLISIVYLGYSSPQLQEEHDKTLTTRTKQRVEREIQQERLKFEEFVFEKKREIDLIDREIQLKTVQHEISLKELENNAKNAQLSELRKLEIEEVQKKNLAQLKFLDGLQSNGVDLTKYLVAKQTKVQKSVVVSSSTEV
eukprot:c20783_g1_i1.p1 GENE.c20783_g1_i1~~c20783_g1_i1.p1  ORF type:complete len:396 (+),score=156.74 c20783_g1_i1:956-2143(+)